MSRLSWLHWFAGDKHHVEDMLVGAATCMLSGIYFIEPYKGITIAPITGDGNYGLCVSGKF